jgi:hypothetical protein
MNHQLDRLFSILSNERFLLMQGLANNDPVYIQPYDVKNEDQAVSMIHSLIQRLRNSGIKVAVADLFQLLLDELRDEQLLDEYADDKADYDKRDLLGDLKNHADAKTRIVPRLAKVMNREGVQLTLLTGVGHVYPFLRAHTILESITPEMMRHPLVMFFPGEYSHTPRLGSQLRLFGTIPPKGYYRAINLDHYRIAQS